MVTATPKVFVRGHMNKYTKDKKILVFENDYAKIVSSDHVSDDMFNNIFIEEIYDDSYKYFLDLENGLILKDVCSVVNDIVLFLNANTKVLLREFVGRSIVPIVSVGERVRKSSRLVMIFTGKREVRYGRSNASGIVFYFTQIEYKPQKYLFVIANDVKVRKIV
ncbi:MAG: DUF2118 domain-containing protein [Candidatus Methanomethylicia archaeon]|nr:DUF2118 domain-containing protein [Candidatus Methanomethylicia archaeon]MCX8169071.1 DUF2118 domain-containing protein [Candidatus Methanomethylicia archaeon]MDW7988803.1 DUF2118 domain-containing protein [Nitrososphaerota archaeon]